MQSIYFSVGCRFLFFPDPAKFFTFVFRADAISPPQGFCASTWALVVTPLTCEKYKKVRYRPRREEQKRLNAGKTGEAIRIAKASAYENNWREKRRRFRQKKIKKGPLQILNIVIM